MRNEAIITVVAVLTLAHSEVGARTIGEWRYPFGGDCVSIQERSGGFIELYRSCDNPNEAPAITKLKKIGEQSYKQEISPRPKWHYRIDRNGNLEIRDSQGVVNTLVARSTTQVPSAAKIATEAKTRGLSCTEIGYRYGYTAAKSLRGEVVDPAWDFVVPVRCRNLSETTQAISAGTKAASER